MRYHVEIEHSAARTLVRLARGDKASARRIDHAIKALAYDPRPPGAVKLVGGEDAWRLRVGDYRIVYTVSDAVRVVTVTRVGHRRDVYDR